MSDKRNKGIIAYGSETDRRKLAALAQLSDKSSSEYLIVVIRDRYAATFGPDEPE